MQAAIKTTVRPVFTQEEQEILAKAKGILIELYQAAGEKDSVILVDRDYNELFGNNIIKNVCVALEKLATVETE